MCSKERNERNIAERTAYLAVLLALSLILSYVEILIPIPLGIPGIKLGLANLVIVIGLERLRYLEVLLILIARIVLVSMLFGNMVSFWYSLAGGILSFTVMLLLKKTGRLSIIRRSMVGGVCHNFGQLLVMLMFVKNIKILYYFPILMVSGTITGFLIGLLAERILQALRIRKG